MIMAVEKGVWISFLSYQTGCNSIGIEYNERFYQTALRNQKKSSFFRKSMFCAAGCGSLSGSCTGGQMLFSLIHSVWRFSNRQWQEYWNPGMKINGSSGCIFYYPSQEYEVYLNGLDELQYEGAVNCMDLFPGNNMREKILIFSLL